MSTVLVGLGVVLPGLLVVGLSYMSANSADLYNTIVHIAPSKSVLAPIITSKSGDIEREYALARAMSQIIAPFMLIVGIIDRVVAKGDLVEISKKQNDSIKVARSLAGSMLVAIVYFIYFYHDQSVGTRTSSPHFYTFVLMGIAPISAFALYSIRRISNV